MIEHIVRAEVMPAVDTTLVVDAVSGTVGGSALNLAHYLGQLGKVPRLVAASGLGDHAKVVEELRRHGLSATDLLEVPGPTDSLICILAGAHHRSVYFRSRLGTAEAQVLAARCRGEAPLILCGSRHLALRGAFVELARSAAGRAVVFSPSYSVFEYTADELAPLLEQVSVTALNGQEAEHACRLLKLRDVKALAAATPGLLIVTLGPQGADVFGPGLYQRVPSVARSPRIAVGAGDAFLAGFVHKWLSGQSPETAARFAATTAAFVVESDRIRVEVSESSIQRRLVELGW
jgi:sugar/nucleoside kinase (ribokinase family)